MTTRVIAHRGARNRRDGTALRENTLGAFTRAIELGAEGIELDVRRTADDVLVIHHDAFIDDGRMVREIESADIPEWMPTLVEALETCKDTWLNIEIKNMPTDPDYDAHYGVSLSVAALVQAFDAADRVLVSSFDFRSVQRIRDHDPGIPIGWLVWEANPIQMVERARGFVDAIHPHDMLVDRRVIDMAREAGLIVNTWTVNDPKRVEDLYNMGIDGVVTDEVIMALDVLRKLRS